MNTNYDSHQTDLQQARYGLRVAARLSAGLDGLPYNISERLRAARQQAVAQRKQTQAVVQLRAAGAVSRNGNTATLSWGSDGMSPWGWLLSAALALALVAGLVVINIVQNDSRTMELADLDTALLTDDLPPEAYADPGFLQYLRSKTDTSVTTR
jgi:hypothetical protein